MGIQKKKTKYYTVMALIFIILMATIAVLWSFHRLWGLMSLIALLVIMFGCMIYVYLRNDDVTENDEVDLDNLDDVKRPLKYMEYDPNEGHLAQIRQLDERLNDQTFVLFVYGTLKRNFHWNHKFLSRGSKYIGNAETVNMYPLMMGDCNVPYVLDLNQEQNKNKEIGQKILGELWHIDYETLIGLDDYEGVNKGHYKRKKIAVVMTADDDGNEYKEKDEIEANIYMKADCQNIDLSKAELLKEFDYEYHKKHYSPIKHIQVKQLAYLDEDYS